MSENLIYRLSHFVTFLAVPDLSQCLNDILPVKYDSTLVVKCYVPGNPDLDLKCELLGENNVALRSEGKYVYSPHANYHEILISREESYYLLEVYLHESAQHFRKKQKHFCIQCKTTRLDEVHHFRYFQLLRLSKINELLK